MWFLRHGCYLPARGYCVHAQLHSCVHAHLCRPECAVWRESAYSPRWQCSNHARWRKGCGTLGPRRPAVYSFGPRYAMQVEGT